MGQGLSIDLSIYICTAPTTTGSWPGGGHYCNMTVQHLFNIIHMPCHIPMLWDCVMKTLCESNASHKRGRSTGTIGALGLILFSLTPVLASWATSSAGIPAGTDFSRVTPDLRQNKLEQNRSLNSRSRLFCMFHLPR